MNLFRRTSVRVWTARVVACTMLLPVMLSPAMAMAAQGKPLPPIMLVLPFAPSQAVERAVPLALGASLTRAVTSSIRSTGKFDVVQFSTSNPSIVRAVEERTLQIADVTPPFEDPTDVVRVAREMGAHYALAGVIEDFDYDSDARRASMSVSAQWIDVKSGRSLKTVAVSMEATGTLDEVTTKLVTEAVNRLLQELAIAEVSVVQPTAVVPDAKKPAVKRGSNIGWVVLGLGLIAALASGARSGGVGADVPPPPP